MHARSSACLPLSATAEHYVTVSLEPAEVVDLLLKSFSRHLPKRTVWNPVDRKARLKSTKQGGKTGHY